MATYEELIKQGYQMSDQAKSYQNMLNSTMANKPADYVSQYDTQLNGLYDQIANRKFSYDLAGDSLYQQYKNQYTNLGKRAMQDTMGQAAALTGGYGNTYAQTAGQQQYNNYLMQMQNIIPELQRNARANFDADTAALKDQYGMLNDRENQAYSRWQDTLRNWQADVDMYNSLFSNERTFDYGLYSDALANAQWQKEFDESVRQFNLNYAKSSAGSSRTYNPGNDDDDGSDGSLTNDQMTAVVNAIESLRNSYMSNEQIKQTILSAKNGMWTQDAKDYAMNVLDGVYQKKATIK